MSGCCNNTGFAPSCATWTKAGSLNPANWYPFASSSSSGDGKTKEGYGCMSCQYPKSVDSWTVGGNVTPANGGVLEGYCGTRGGIYNTLCSTWAPQSKYQSG